MNHYPLIEGVTCMPGESLENVSRANTYFYSLVKPNTPKKRRFCLKCNTEFLSAHYGNRVCGSCAAQNTRAAVRAQKIL